MFSRLLAEKAEERKEAKTIRRDHMNEQERDKERARDDQARRDLSSDNAEYQRSLPALAALSQTNIKPASPSTAASGLMPMAITPEAPTRTAAPHIKPHSIAPTSHLNARIGVYASGCDAGTPGDHSLNTCVAAEEAPTGRAHAADQGALVGRRRAVGG